MHLQLKNIGPIADADIRFGDLIVFVGPQATGNSITLQFLKLVLDMGQVQAELARHGLDWSGRLSDFFAVYFGEGMGAIWGHGQSQVTWRNRPVDLPRLIEQTRRSKVESLFYVPAQPVLTLRDGWPRPFTDYKPGDPFTVREFSEKLRLLVEQDFSASESLFPQERRLKPEFRRMLEQQVFGKFGLRIDKVHSQKRLVLGNGGQPLPYMVWSAGQREFVPLLLGLYWLIPPAGSTRRGKIQWIVLEELEMGLHARAIKVLILMIFELLTRGYHVCLSSHSSQVLEAIWALRHLRRNGASPRALLGIFQAPDTQPMRKLAETVMTKKVKVYYFDPASGKTQDISELDVDGEEAGDDGWGGLSEFSGQANTVVAIAVANSRRTRGD